MFLMSKLYIVIDLSDGGASHIAETVKEIKKRCIILSPYFVYYYNKILCIYILNKHFIYMLFIFLQN